MLLGARNKKVSAGCFYGALLHNMLLSFVSLKVGGVEEPVSYRQFYFHFYFYFILFLQNVLRKLLTRWLEWGFS